MSSEPFPCSANTGFDSARKVTEIWNGAIFLCSVRSCGQDRRDILLRLRMTTHHPTNAFSMAIIMLVLIFALNGGGLAKADLAAIPTTPIPARPLHFHIPGVDKALFANKHACGRVACPENKECCDGGCCSAVGYWFARNLAMLMRTKGNDMHGKWTWMLLEWVSHP
jgi:hypothetical protein